MKGDSQKRLRAQASAAMEARIADAAKLLGPLEFAIPSHTMLDHSAFNATAKLREFVLSREIHDYEPQQWGRHPHGIVKNVDYYSLGESGDIVVRTIELVMYRTPSNGERRLNILGSNSFIEQGDFLAFVSAEIGALQVVNFSQGLNSPEASVEDSRWLDLIAAVQTPIPSDLEVVVEAMFDASGDQLPSRPTRGQGFSHDQAKKKAVELYAVDRAIAYYESIGGTDKKEVGAPYDLSFTLNGAERRVEVKGSRNSLESVLVTIGEVNHAKGAIEIDLFVVDQIELALNDAKEWVPSMGRERRWEIWRPDANSLKALAFKHTLSRGFAVIGA